MLSLYKRRPKATTLNGLLPEGYTVEENVDTLVREKRQDLAHLLISDAGFH